MLTCISNLWMMCIMSSSDSFQTFGWRAIRARLLHFKPLEEVKNASWSDLMMSRSRPKPSIFLQDPRKHRLFCETNLWATPYISNFTDMILQSAMGRQRGGVLDRSVESCVSIHAYIYLPMPTYTYSVVKMHTGQHVLIIPFQNEQLRTRPKSHFSQKYALFTTGHVRHA